MTPTVALTIAGSDSGGGAGIQADLKTFHAFGCFGTSAITAITAQNTLGVSAVMGVEPAVVSAQIRDVLADLPVRAAKTGMLFSTEIIEAVAEAWSEHGRGIPLVVDPVMVAASGARLLESSAERALIDFLKTAALITPNLPEAAVILGHPVETLADMRGAVRELHALTGASVLLKGGHRARHDERADEAVDLLLDVSVSEGGARNEPAVYELARPLLATTHTHGTGCTLSAAIVAGLAQGQALRAAMELAREFLHGAITYAPALGSGAGPLNHMWRGMERDRRPGSRSAH